MERISRLLANLPFPVILKGIPALELYYNKEYSRIIQIFTTASLIEVAKEFEEPRFPGCDFADILVSVSVPDSPHTVDLAFSCIDSDFPEFSETGQNCSATDLFSFSWIAQSRVFRDPKGVYRHLRTKELNSIAAENIYDVINLALLASRLGFRFSNEIKKSVKNTLRQFQDSIEWSDVSTLHQRYILATILAGSRPQAGLQILKDAGFIKARWPELYQLIETAHDKEFHPEGNVWEHTLETFKYRKSRDFCLSLGLLLHDAGKPKANRESGNTFNRHAQIGAAVAGRFLSRLEFEYTLVEDVKFLVKNHMLPAFISRLPVFRTEQVMSSPLFPLLLELYRCDLSSTFRSPDEYYAACKTYRRFLKNTRNPFRSAEGKKLLRLYVEAR